MKKQILFFVALLSCYLPFQAQNYITVDHNGIPTLYSTITAAIAGALSGDHMYIPGGTFTENITIDKELQIYGAGHYADSAISTIVTTISGTVTFITGADGGSFSGCKITGNVMYGSADSNEVINNHSLSRCRLGSLYLSYNPNGSFSETQNIFISENVISSIYGGVDSLIMIEKNIITGILKFFSNTAFKNNIFTYYNQSSGCAVRCVIGETGNHWVDDCLFENNIILDYDPLRYRSGNLCITYYFGGLGNSFSNNLFTYNQSFPASTNDGTNNIPNILIDSIFVNYSTTGFSYDNDYHLKPTCPGVGAGTDGYDIGIYGTGEPYKEGAVPVNPHIRSKSISVQNNQISVEVEVGAQDR